MRLTALSFYLLLAGLLCFWILPRWDAQISWFNKSIESFRKQEEKYREQNDLNKIDSENHRFIVSLLPHYERNLHQSIRIRKITRWIGFGLIVSAVFIPPVFFKKVKRSALQLMVRDPVTPLSRTVVYSLTGPGLFIFLGALILVVWPVGIREPLYLTDDLKHAVVLYCFLTCLLLWSLTRIYMNRLRLAYEADPGMGCLHASLLLFYILGFLLLLISTSDLNIIPNFAQ